jgi:arginyl-tRNA--protein-N-Asp/Glu arginylyltransferase
MKLYFGEFKANYGKYHFPYQVWLLKENGDEVEKIYNQGFLPMRSRPNVYYLSRSVRVDLAKFEPSSENRRILKKTEDFQVILEPMSKFSYTPRVQKFCKEYVVKRSGASGMTTATIRSIFKKRVYNYIFVWKDKKTQKEVGFVVCFISPSLLQYAHAFYDLDYLERSLGARMILEAVQWAKQNGRSYAYLGTCYDRNSLYKTEFKGVEFFNGFAWSSNLEELKSLIDRSEEEYLLKDKQFKDRFYKGDLSVFLSNFGVRVSF